MPKTTADSTSADSAPRVLSVDALRGLTMFTMVFVNDVAGAKGLPGWLEHFPAKGNGMTFVDVVFPAFLFIVGISIPLAIEGRRAKGDGSGKIYGHIVLRALALLAMGVLMVGTPDDGRMGWRHGLWKTLMYAGLIATFHHGRFSRPGARSISVAVRMVGGVLLVFLAIMFRSRDGSAIQPRWWGILGLIGWAYFWAASAYLLLRREGRAALLGASALFFCVFFAARAGAFASVEGWTVHLSGRSLSPGTWVNFADQWGALPAVVLAGTVIGQMLLQNNPAGDSAATDADRMRFAAVFALLTAVAGLLLYKSFGINKNAATPTWCLFSISSTTLLWLGLFAAIDVAGWRKWATPLAWAGASALLIYILAGLWNAAASIVVWPAWEQAGAHYPAAASRALATALVLSFLGALLGRFGFRLRV